VAKLLDSIRSGLATRRSAPARVFRGDGRVLESAQTYEQQLGQPWYRLYYDTREKVTVFPDLEPAIRSSYAIGSMTWRIGTSLPITSESDECRLHAELRVEYVLITAASRRFYFAKPRVEGLRYQARLDRGPSHRNGSCREPARHPPGRRHARRDRDQPLPPRLDLPYWSEVGSGTGGSSGSALCGRIVETSRQGTDRERERHPDQGATRLSLGGEKYALRGAGVRHTWLSAVSSAAGGSARFGDCKDKASLMFTMLREAGIESRIVLVRTRSNGAVADFPASLAVFDHVIVYVPELDLYLDGTAEHSGTVELPVGDQGVMALLVGSIPRSCAARQFWSPAPIAEYEPSGFSCRRTVQLR